MPRHRLTLIAVFVAIGSLGVAVARCAEVVPADTLPAQSSTAVSGTARDVDPALDGEPPISKPIGSLTVDIRPPDGELPAGAAAKRLPQNASPADAQRYFAEQMFFWEPSNLSHLPLRFEQPYVERYGYNYGLLQPVVSGAQFFGDVAAWPVKCLVVPPRRPIYTLGAGRPGSYGARRP